MCVRENKGTINKILKNVLTVFSDGLYDLTKKCQNKMMNTE